MEISKPILLKKFNKKKLKAKYKKLKPSMPSKKNLNKKDSENIKFYNYKKKSKRAIRKSRGKRN